MQRAGHSAAHAGLARAVAVDQVFCLVRTRQLGPSQHADVSRGACHAQDCSTLAESSSMALHRLSTSGDSPVPDRSAGHKSPQQLTQLSKHSLSTADDSCSSAFEGCVP